MRIRVAGFDDVSTENDPYAQTSELIHLVYVVDTYVGEIRYRSRRVRRACIRGCKCNGSHQSIEWGWQPVKAPRNSALLTKSEAIASLLAMDGPGRVAAAAREAVVP